jgi:hypothetical protein
MSVGHIRWVGRSTIRRSQERSHRRFYSSRHSRQAFTSIAFATLVGGYGVATVGCVPPPRERVAPIAPSEVDAFAPSSARAASVPPAPTDNAARPSEANANDTRRDSASNETSEAIVNEPGHADLDPANDGVVGPPAVVVDCEAQLLAAGVEFRHASLPVRVMDRGAWSCGAEQVVQFRGSTSAIRYNASPLLTCTMALGLARFERILQEEAAALFQSKVTRIQHGGTYNCRRMARFDMVSEHSFANAIDLVRLTLANGVTIDVVRHFGNRSEEPSARESQFLRRVARRAYDENLFSVVLTPLFDPLHRDHFHLDMARYRVDGSR